MLGQNFNQLHPPSQTRRRGGSLKNCGEAPQHREAPHPDVAHSADWIEGGTKGEVTDYLTRAKGTQLELQEAGEMTSNAMFSAMVLKGLPSTFESIATVLFFGPRKDYEEMKQDIINFANTRAELGTDVVSTAFHSSGGNCSWNITCFKCQKEGTHDDALQVKDVGNANGSRTRVEGRDTARWTAKAGCLSSS